MANQIPQSDAIVLDQLQLTCIIGKDAWGRQKPQPILLSVTAYTDIAAAAKEDTCNFTINYGSLQKDLVAKAMDIGLTFGNLIQFMEVVGLIVINRPDTRPSFGRVLVELPEALLMADSFGANALVDNEGKIDVVSYIIKNLRTTCIVGVNPHERQRKQPVILNITILQCTDDFASQYMEIVDQVIQLVESTAFQTLEALTTYVVENLFKITPTINKVEVRIEKPKAMTFVRGAGVSITRTRGSLETEK